MRSITAVTLARWSPWRRRQMQPVIRSLPLLPPSLMLLLLATCISSKIVAIGVSGLVALLLAPPAAHSQRGRGLRLPITACCLRPRNDNAVRSRRPNEVRRILVGDLAHWRVQTKHRMTLCSAAQPRVHVQVERRWRLVLLVTGQRGQQQPRSGRRALCWKGRSRSKACLWMAWVSLAILLTKLQAPPPRAHFSNQQLY
jgi:hypothetical protein